MCTHLPTVPAHNCTMSHNIPASRSLVLTVIDTIDESCPHPPQLCPSQGIDVSLAASAARLLTVSPPYPSLIASDVVHCSTMYIYHGGSICQKCRDLSEIGLPSPFILPNIKYAYYGPLVLWSAINKRVEVLENVLRVNLMNRYCSLQRRDVSNS